VTGGFFALLDDIATLLDDAAVVTKVAAKKTTGILGDDLAVNAQKASGFAASRELPVLWAITKGSFRNKLIILPLAFLLSAYASWAIVPILMLGGVYLSYEGVEKIYEYFFPHTSKHHRVEEEISQEELLKKEAKKISSAIRTDFILSIEIVIIALGTVIEQPLPIQIVAVTVVALLATIGVYGFVALLVRMDDFGFALIERAKDQKSLLHKMGRLLVVSLPKVIRALTVIGTFAMLLVGGGIFMHNIHQLHDILHFLPSLLGELLTGGIVGSIALGMHLLYVKFFSKEKRD
jgi:predicted DNA repair protein MutK